jgi:hypothetical protein
MSSLTDEATSWLTIAEAASRLGLSPFGVRSRIKRGTLRTRKGNHGRVLVAMPASDLANDLMSAPTGALTNHLANQPASDLNGRADLLVQVARLEERLAASERRETDLQALVADLRHDREALQATVDRLASDLVLARKGWLAPIPLT